MDKFELAKQLFFDGLSQIKNDNFEMAEATLLKSLELLPDRVSTLTNLSAVQIKLKKFDQARVLVQRALAIDKDYVEAWLNLGLIELETKNYVQAIQHFNTAMELKPDYAEAWSNRGLAQYDLKHYETAISDFENAIRLKPDYADAWLNSGLVLYELERNEQATLHFETAIKLKPDIDFLFGILVHEKMGKCDWNNFDGQVKTICEKLNLGKKVTPSFPCLALIDDEQLHRKAAEIWVNEKCPLNTRVQPILRTARQKKIRIGYFSADFHNHATAHLMAELFELHDKERFEIYAFSYGKQINDEMWKRLSAAFDQFINVEFMTDLEVAMLSRTMQIDIAVDLKGFTRFGRTGIFADRAAPVQVNYLGYPGTLGSSYIDYVIADPIIIPAPSQQYYSEKVVYLPNTYQVNDSRRKIADRQFKRLECGLPDGAFVFCCFNNNYKITPATFDSWMRILKQVKDSVLWLLGDNDTVIHNLRNEAAARGIAGERLIFAKREILPEHLARHRLADLFLDTLPYNAHTTTSDALWAGLPVLTRTGQSFAGRVSASLLTAIDLPELITHSQEEFEAVAIDLAANPEKLAHLKQKLCSNRLTTPLFDAALFTKHIETAFSEMYERYQNDLPPEHIYVHD